MSDLERPPKLQKALTILHYVYPLLTAVSFFISVLVSVCTLQTLSPRVRDQQIRKDVILKLMIALVLEYAAHAVLAIICTFAPTGWVASEDEIVYLIFSALVWCIQVLALTDAKFPIWYPYYVNWVTGLLFEITFIVIPVFSRPSMAAFDYITVSVQAIRLLNLVFLIFSYAFVRNSGESHKIADFEQRPLLSNRPAPEPSSSEGSNPNTSGYGTAATQTAQDRSGEEDSHTKAQRESRERMEKRLMSDGNWWTYARGFAIFFPYIWPVHSKPLQFRALLVGCSILATNALNFLVPRQLGAVTDALVRGDGWNAWCQVVVYAILTFLNSGACLGWLQYWLWLPLQQYSYDALNNAAQSHVMSLSSDFHESKDASEIHQALVQGRSIISLVDTICFQVLPTFVDLFLVGAYLFFLFGPYMMLDLLATMIFYIYITSKLVTMAQERRRAYITECRNEWTSANSCIDNWRVSTYFNNIPYEVGRFAQKVKNHLKSERSYKFAAKLVTAAQSLILAIGLLGGCFLAVYQVMNKTRSPGDFVILLTYWAQIGGPLYFFSNMYKSISESMIDAERLLELFQTKPSIVDLKDAQPLKLGKGQIKFESVGYHYDDNKETLKKLDFTIRGGSTVAIVGETGGGKSTILKLINRLYDVTSGRILIDGQDIREVTLTSLHHNIGIVPQEPTLFNDSIMNNVRYARLTASDSEVYDACKAAAIHDKIMSFPNGYNSQVGKRGIKLSGGEQQRIAIARAILKQADIILLDEATSAVDTETERLIYLGLNKLCRGRTTVTVAHRLSTILSADCIMVLKNGVIVEAGTHNELISREGKYSELWSQQTYIKSASGPSGLS